MAKIILLLFVVLLNVSWIKSGTRDPSADPTTCQQQAGNAATTSNTQCQTIDTSNSGACSAAQPTVSQLTNEPCTNSSGKKRRDAPVCALCNKCYWSYYSRIVGQQVCVGQRIVSGLQQGVLQYKLGLQLLTKCDKTMNGLQKCVADYGHITCNNSVWKVSAICDQDQVCREGQEVVFYGETYVYKSWRPYNPPLRYEERTIQKAKCVPAVLGEYPNRVKQTP